MPRWSIVFIWTAVAVLSESKRLREDYLLKETRKTSIQEATHLDSDIPQVSRKLLKIQRSSGTWQLGVVHNAGSEGIVIKFIDSAMGTMHRPLATTKYQNVKVEDRIYLKNRAGAWVEGKVTDLDDLDDTVTVAYQTNAGPLRIFKVSFDDAIGNFLLEPPVVVIQKALPEAPPPVIRKVPDFCDTSSWFCSNEHRWTRTKNPKGIVAPIDKGSYGQVWTVYSQAEKQKQVMTGADEVAVSAIKYPVSLKSVPGSCTQGDCKDNRKEVEKMKSLTSEVAPLPGCENSFMKIVDEFPCVKADALELNLFVPIPGYVMDQMSGTLKTWKTSARTKKLSVQQYNHCLTKITEMVYQALKCFHDGGWVHADFKIGNVLFLGYGTDDGCPEEVRLADFGLSGRIGSASTDGDGLWDYEAYKGAWYLPMDMFEMPSDPYPYPLGLARTRTWLDAQGMFDIEPHFIRDVQLDWCSFAFEWKNYLGLELCAQPGDWQGDCGPMGPGRDASTDLSNKKRIKILPC